MRQMDNYTGSYIRMLRREAGVNQTAIAKLLGVQRTTYSHYETGRIQPSSEKLVQLADYYQVPLDTMFRSPVLDGEAEAGARAVETGSAEAERDNALSRPPKSRLPEITADDLLLLATFHHLTGKEQKAVQSMIREMAKG